MLSSLWVLLLLFCSDNFMSTEGNGDQTDYRLTRLEIVTSQQISELRTTMKEDFREIKRLIPFLSRNFTPSIIEEPNYPKSCAELYQKGSKTNGVYKIKPGKRMVYAYCEMETGGGGWTVIQKRYSGDIEFFNGWKDYKNGFGNLLGEFWLGLDTLYELTNDQVNELVIELEDFDGAKKVAKYEDFVIGSEEEGYAIKILGPYFGDAGDSLIQHAGAKFSTKDNDQDLLPDNCAVLFTGAWWYKACHVSNLNGKYLKGVTSVENRAKGMCWITFRGHDYSLKTSKMSIRPKHFKV